MTTDAATAIESATAIKTAIATSPSPIRPEDLRAAFARDGYLLLRGLLEPSRLDPLRAAINGRVAEIRRELEAEGLVPSGPAMPFARNLVPLTAHIGRYGRGWTAELASEAVYDLHHAPELLTVLQAMLGDQVCGHLQFNLRPKLPGQELTTVPWHQDTAYYGPQTVADTIITAWLPLVSATADNGCLQIIPGSHHDGAMEHDAGIGEGRFLQIRGWPDPARVLTLEMAPGDVLLMHNLLWHCSQPNRTEDIRWSIDMRFYAPSTPNAGSLLWGFPRPWLLCSGPVVPAAEWMSWYRHRN